MLCEAATELLVHVFGTATMRLYIVAVHVIRRALGEGGKL